MTTTDRPPHSRLEPAATATVRHRPGRRAMLAALAGSLVLAMAVTALFGPRPPRPGETTTGDAALAAQVRELAGDGGYGAMAVALIADGEVRFAGLGRDTAGEVVDEHTRFEIGSIGKALTGMLLADLAEAGEVDLDQRVGDLVPGTPLADNGESTLAELASHRSGLPRISTRPADLLRGVGALFIDPYAGSPEQVLEAAASAGADGGGSHGYSNLGAGTLGSSLAVHQGQPYGQVLRQRVLDPLAMADTVVVSDRDGLPQRRAVGVTRSGHRQPPWIAEGYAGAGVGIWSTSADLARLATAVLDGTSPGQSATEPRWPAGASRIGLGWVTSEIDGHTVVWHNGATGGFRSWLGVDQDTGRAVVVLAATTRDVDELGQRLLIGEGS